MHTVSLFEAKTHLSRIVEALVTGGNDQVVITRRGKPVVRLAPLSEQNTSKRIGIARGQFSIPDDIDRTNETIATIFSHQAVGE